MMSFIHLACTRINIVILTCICLRINVRMYECDDLELLIRFAVDTVHCLHVFAFNLLIYLFCIQMHIHACMHICTCVYTMYIHTYIHVYVHMLMCMLKHNDIMK